MQRQYNDQGKELAFQSEQQTHLLCKINRMTRVGKSDSSKQSPLQYKLQTHSLCQTDGTTIANHRHSNIGCRNNHVTVPTVTLVAPLPLNSEHVYSLYQSDGCLLQSFLPILSLLLLLHRRCVCCLHWSFYCLLQSLYCFYIASVSIACITLPVAYSGRSTAFTPPVCLMFTRDGRWLTPVVPMLLHSGLQMAHIRVPAACSNLSIALTSRTCLQPILKFLLITIVLLMLLRREACCSAGWLASRPDGWLAGWPKAEKVEKVENAKN